MRKTFLKVSLITCLAIASSAAFTGCKDYDDDINNINGRLDKLEETVKSINDKVQSGCVITSVTPVDGGVKVTLSDNTDFTITNGKDGATGATGEAGKPGTVWTIADGTAGKYTWFCDGKDMGISAQGPQGPQGDKGETGAPGQTGPAGAVSAVVYYVPNAETGCFTKVTIGADGKETKEETPISFLAPGTITATAADGILTLYGVKGADGKVLDPIEISMTGDLRSLVFIPNLYLNGVEGTRYAYAPYEALTFRGGETVTEAEPPVEGEERPKATLEGKSLWDAAAAVTRTIYPVDTMAYELNPSNANLKDLTFSYLNASKEAVSRAAAPAEVKFVGPATDDGEGNLKVPYNVVNAENIKDPAQDKDAEFSTFALTTTLTDENVITSDYATLVPAARVLRAIAFTEASTYKTDKAENEYEGYKAQDDRDLYWTGVLAVENNASIKIQYNKGSIDLSKLLEIHYNQLDYAKFADVTADLSKNGGVMTLDDLNAYGLRVRYDMVPYVIGVNDTRENQYGKVNNVTGVFTPQYVTESGTSADCGVEGTDTEKVGISAAGRRPVVRVVVDGEYEKAGKTVVDTVLVGYIKIGIEEQVIAPEKYETILPEFKNPYVCSFENVTTWVQWTANVLENTVHLTPKEFISDYEFDATNVYMKVGDEFVSTIKVDNVDTSVKSLYGTLTFEEDSYATSTNAAIEWSATAAQIENIASREGRTVTIYAKFTSKKSGSVLYVGLKTTIAPVPTAIYGTQIPTSWYNIENGEAGTNSIHVNDAVPGNKNGNSTYYFAGNINDTWEGNAVKISTQTEGYTFVGNAADVDEAKGKVLASYSYLFNTVQPVIAKGDVKYYLSTDATQKNLYVSKTSATATDRVLIATLSNGSATTKDATTNNALIKYVSPEGLAKNSLQLEFINLFAHSETEKANKTYANIDIVTTYGECLRKVNPFSFNARFLRPVDVVEGTGANFVDAAANGSSEPIGKFFGLVDWRDKPLFSASGTGSALKFVATIDNGYNNLYEYYGVEKVSLDLAKVETNQMGDWKLMSNVNKNLELVLKDKDGNVVTPTNGVASLTINVDPATSTTSTTETILEVLKESTITYYNNGTTTAQFSLRIPVTITYAWGEVTAKVTATVGKTIANAPRK